MTSREQLKDHLDRCVHLVRSVLMKRAITAINPDPNLNFWRLILGNQMDIAVLEWCKLFGSNSEPTHWKQVVPADKHENFRKDLIAHAGTTREGWSSYWEELKNYRDNVAAHFNRDSAGPSYPELEIAIKSGCFYYKYIIHELKALDDYSYLGYPDELETYCKDFEEQTKQIAQVAISATKSMEENVR
jgi:hypothetical protein